MEPRRVELLTSCVQSRRSPNWTTATRLIILNGPKWDRTTDPRVISTVLYRLSYGPGIKSTNPLIQINHLIKAIKNKSLWKEIFCFLLVYSLTFELPSFSLNKKKTKGGDPAARSRTATLLRLSANHEIHRDSASRASGAPHFQRLTGGVYNARERIHRNMLICDY